LNKNNLSSCISELECDEFGYKKIVKKLYNTLQVYHQENQVISELCNSLRLILQLSEDIQQSVEECPDMVIIKRIPQILKNYGDYLQTFKTFRDVLTKDSNFSSELLFQIEGVRSFLPAPFQRLLAYRHYLQRIYKCEQHVCQTLNCDGKRCDTKFAQNLQNQNASNQLNDLIQECYETFEMVDNYKAICKWEDSLDVDDCRSLGVDDDLVVMLFVDFRQFLCSCLLHLKIQSIKWRYCRLL
jgi:hypothetical protein